MKCPFRDLEECSKDCALFSWQERKYAHKVDTVRVEGCVFVLILAELENHSAQNSMVHAQTGEVANNVLYQAAAMMGSGEGLRLLKKKTLAMLGEKENDTPVQISS